MPFLPGMIGTMVDRAVPDEIIEARDGRPEIIIRRSARRRRTLSARMEGTSVLVMVPMGMREAGQDRQVMELVDKVTKSCLLYTSDAADDMQCVDLGGRRFGTTTRLSQRRGCLLYTSPSPRDQRGSRMPSSA